MSQLDRLSQGAPRHASLQDQRPFQDKAYIAESVVKLYVFLQEQAYPHHTTRQLLARMSTGEFENVLTFLLKFLEPNFAVGRGARLEDVVLEHLRTMQYPYPLHRSMLTAIGSQPHKALAIITWLADVIKYHVSLSPLDDFFCSCGNGSMGNLLQFMLNQQDGDTEAIDERLDELVLDIVGPVEPVDDLKKALAEQEEELQRLTATLNVHEARKADLQVKKQKLENYNTYFKEMADHVEAKSAAVAANEERLVALNAERQSLKELLAEAQALHREQCLRQEDEETLQQRQQRLQLDICSAGLQLEKLKGEYQLCHISWYNGREQLRQQLTEVRESFKMCASEMSWAIPREVLEDFDLHLVEDERSLQRQEVSNAAAFAEVFRLLDEAEEKLHGCIQQDRELCEQEKRKKARQLDEEYAMLCKKICELQHRIHQKKCSSVQEAEMRLADAKVNMANAIVRQQEAIAASDEELRNFLELVKTSYQEHMDIMQECHDKLIDAIEELHKM